MNPGNAWLSALMLVLSTPAIAAQDAGDELSATAELPESLVQEYISDRQWVELDALIEKLAASGERADDGRFRLSLVAGAIGKRLEFFDPLGPAFEEKLSEYHRQVPGSAFAAILDAMHVHAMAWRARGRGLASSVAPEGWALFRERNAAAWQLILEAKKTSARLPTWYEQALYIGADARISIDVLTAIFNEGIKRFPGYHSLYFNYARQFAPRWGGDYETADAFVNAQVAAKTNPEGEVLYTRLYWLIDQYAGADLNFFSESRVVWSRMRTGFELLMKQYPNSRWNHANFVAFACRAGDGATYWKWRQTVELASFLEAAPEGISLEICDVRFTKKI